MKERRASRRVADLITAANAGRPPNAAVTQRVPPTEAEAALDGMFNCQDRLAVYGTLAPGRTNHHVVEPLGGAWVPGLVEGELIAQGWGAALGYRALVIRPGATIGVQVLTTPQLGEAWPRLDVFEGEEYRRILVPVFTVNSEPKLLTVANIYVAAKLGFRDEVLATGH